MSPNAQHGSKHLKSVYPTLVSLSKLTRITALLSALRRPIVSNMTVTQH